jgi:hypothetical protein
MHQSINPIHPSDPADDGYTSWSHSVPMTDMLLIDLLAYDDNMMYRYYSAVQSFYDSLYSMDWLTDSTRIIAQCLVLIIII